MAAADGIRPTLLYRLQLCALLFLLQVARIGHRREIGLVFVVLLVLALCLYRCAVIGLLMCSCVYRFVLELVLLTALSCYWSHHFSSNRSQRA